MALARTPGLEPCHDYRTSAYSRHNCSVNQPHETNNAPGLGRTRIFTSISDLMESKGDGALSQPPTPLYNHHPPMHIQLWDILPYHW